MSQAVRPQPQPKPQTQPGIRIRCLECGKTFRRKPSARLRLDAYKCPKCGGYDTEPLDY